MATRAALSRNSSAASSSAAADAVRHDDTRVTADQASATASIRTLGTGSAQAAAGNHAHTSQAVGAAMDTLPTATKTANYTAAAGEMVMVDATGGAITITLPVISATGQRVAVKKIDSSVNVVTVAAGAGNTIGTAAGASVPIRLNDQTGNFVASGTNWALVSNHLGLPSLDSRYGAAASPTFTGVVTAPVVISTPVVLTDAATIVVDASLGQHFRVTLGGNRTLGAPSNPVDGQKILFEVIQDGTGSRTLAYNAIYVFGTDIGQPTLSSTAAKTDYLGFVYSSAATKWRCLAWARGY
jgi:hypothetical protein